MSETLRKLKAELAEAEKFAKYMAEENDWAFTQDLAEENDWAFTQDLAETKGFAIDMVIARANARAVAHGAYAEVVRIEDKIAQLEKDHV